MSQNSPATSVTLSSASLGRSALAALSSSARLSPSSSSLSTPTKRVHINPNPVTIPSTVATDPLTSTAASPAATVRGTIPVTDASDPSKVKNVIFSVSSPVAEHSYANNDGTDKKADSSSDSSSSTSSSSSSSSDEEESDVEDQAEKVVQNILQGQPKPAVSTPSTPASAKRGRPRKNPPNLLPAVTPSPKKEVQEDGEEMKNRKRGRGCGACPGCVRADCGKCQYCKDKPKFGGPGKKKQRCSLRVCSNFVSHASMNSSNACLNQYVLMQVPVAGVRNATHTPQAATVANSKIAESTRSSTRAVEEINKAAVTPSAPPPPPPVAPSPLKKQGTPGTATQSKKQATPGGTASQAKKPAGTASSVKKPATPAGTASPVKKQGKAVATTVPPAAPVSDKDSNSQVERCVSLCVLTSLCLLENFHNSKVRNR